MANEYKVTLQNGEVYNVTTVKHHDDYDYEWFKQHLALIIKELGIAVAAHHIVEIIFKGKKH